MLAQGFEAVGRSRHGAFPPSMKNIIAAGRVQCGMALRVPSISLGLLMKN